MHGIAAWCREEDMTAKRNFKRRVRERQLRTGEHYTTARRQLLAERAEAAPVPEPESPPEPGAAPQPVAVPVIELLDVTDEAARLGLRCRVAMFPSLAERVAPASVLTRLRDVLIGTAGDPATSRLCAVALTGQDPPRPTRTPRDIEALRRFLQRARAGLGGTTDDGTMLALHVAGRDGIVPVLCTLTYHHLSIALMAVDSTDVELQDQLSVPLVAGRAVSVLEPGLFLIHSGRSYPISIAGLVIGRGRGPAELAIGTDASAPMHAAVLHRNGTYYLKQLESPEGIVYKGMHIDNKRIDEGDVFHIGDHELRFTYRAGGEVLL
jgi:hypothetical protein